MKLWHLALSVAPAALALLPASALAASPSCETLSKLSFPDATIDRAESVPAGDFTAAAARFGLRGGSADIPRGCLINQRQPP